MWKCDSTGNSLLWPEMELDQGFMSVLVICKFEEDPLKSEGIIVSSSFFSGAHGQVTPKSMDGCGRNSNSSEILCLSWLPASLMTIRSKMRALLCPQNFLHYKSMAKIFGAQGQVTPTRVVQSGSKSNWCEILCLSSLSASLKKI